MKIPKWSFMIAFFAFLVIAAPMPKVFANGDAAPDGVPIYGVWAVAEEDVLDPYTGVPTQVTVFGGTTGYWIPCSTGCPTVRLAWLHYASVQDACNNASVELAARQRDVQHFGSVTSWSIVVPECGGSQPYLPPPVYQQPVYNPPPIYNPPGQTYGNCGYGTRLGAPIPSGQCRVNEDVVVRDIIAPGVYNVYVTHLYQPTLFTDGVKEGWDGYPSQQYAAGEACKQAARDRNAGNTVNASC